MADRSPPPRSPRVDASEVELSILIPVLNDAAALGRLLTDLTPALDARLEVIVIDGGSTDASIAVASGFDVHLLEGARGRGAQLALGVQRARGRWLWMLHADSCPEPKCISYLRTLADRPGWGRFSVHIEGNVLLDIVAWMMNRRSCLTGICTGDQGIFVQRQLLRAAGGMPAQPLMEDIELSRRLRRLARPICRAERIGTSARRWQAHGVVRTVVSMWWFRLRYWRGADADRLAREYYR